MSLYKSLGSMFALAVSAMFSHGVDDAVAKTENIASERESRIQVDDHINNLLCLRAGKNVDHGND